MSKKTKNTEVKSQSKDSDNVSSQKLSKQDNIKENNTLKRNYHYEKQSRELYQDLITSVNKWFNEREIKVKPDQVFRKHIPWKQILQSMINKNYKIKDVNELKRHWLEVCKYIKVERPLMDILSESDQAIDKILKVPTQSGYSVYQLEQRPKLRDKYPELKFIELHQKIAKRWRKLTDEQKKYYTDIAEEENLKNGVGIDRKSRKRKVLTKTVETYNYPTTSLRDFYVSYKASELKNSNPSLTYKERRSIASSGFSKCSITDLSEIKKLYLDNLQQFVDKVNSEDSQFISQIGQHIMETKRLRPLLEQPIISRFLSTINLANVAPSKSRNSSKSSESDENDSRVVEKYEDSALSSEEISDDN